MDCGATAAQQLVTLERRPGNEIRSWAVISTDLASGPLDPAIARVAVYSSHIVGLGICAPKSFGGPSSEVGSSIEAIWPINTGGPVVTVGRSGTAPRLTVDDSGPGTAVLYGPPIFPGPTAEPVSKGPEASTPPDAAVVWPFGSYAVAFVFPADPTQQRRWLRIDILPSGREG
jgi:hypothetical protein